MLRLVIFLFFLISLSNNTAFAQSKGQFDRTNLKQDQMLKALTKLLTRVVKLEESGPQTEKINELKLEVFSLKETILNLEKNLMAVSSELTTTTEGFLGLRDDIVDVYNVQIPGLDTRVLEIETVLEADRASDRIVIDNITGSPKLFKVSELGTLIDALPSMDDCGEVGDILFGRADRDYNLLFVKDNGGEVVFCKNDHDFWEVVPSNDREPGHVVLAD